MTTSPSPDTAPPTSTPPPAPDAAPPAPPRLTKALAGLVHDGTLTPAQADAVVAAWAARADGEAPEAPGPAASLPALAQRAAETWRTRLLEAAVYLGAAFVLAAVGIVVGQAWTGLSRGSQVVLAGGLTALGLMAGLVVGLPVRPTDPGPLDPAHAVRRRSASVVLTASAALAAGTLAVVLGDGTGTGVAAAAAALAVMVLCQVVAPSVLSELALFAAAALTVGAAAAAVVPMPDPYAEPGAWDTRGRVVAGLLLGFAALWAWVLAARLRHRLVGVTVALVLAVGSSLALQGMTTAPAVVALTALAVATTVTYLRDPEWPWVTAAVVAATCAVFILAGETVGVAVAFLVAGLVLLGGVAVAVLLGRRRRRRAAQGAGLSPTLRPPTA